jgi:hypothetical protein
MGRKKKTEPVCNGIVQYYAVWWKGKTVQKTALTKLFGRNLSFFIIRLGQCPRVAAEEH